MITIGRKSRSEGSPDPKFCLGCRDVIPFDR